MQHKWTFSNRASPSGDLCSMEMPIENYVAKLHLGCRRQNHGIGDGPTSVLMPSLATYKAEMSMW